MSLWNVFIILAFVGYCTYIFWPDTPQPEEQEPVEPEGPIYTNMPADVENDWLIDAWRAEQKSNKK